MNEAENKQKYELAYLLNPGIAEEKLDLETAELKKIISENSGELTESVTPKKRLLAYPVKKLNQAYFGVIYFNANKENLDRIKKELSFNKNVLRLLIISEDKALNKQAVKSEPSAAPMKTMEEKTPESITPSFDKKLESILNG